MGFLPVDNLDANTITLANNPLIDSNGNLSYNGNIIAKISDLIKTSFVGTTVERDLLQAKDGDVCKVTNLNVTYIYNGTSWISINQESFLYSTVANITERDLLNPKISEICFVTSENKQYIYNGISWILLTGTIINDASTSTTEVWSSSKTDFEIKNHGHDGGTW